LSEKKCYYEILSISKTAGGSQVKAAYRKAALQHHPDRNPGDEVAEAAFKEASEAYEVLSDEAKRSTYDQFGHQGLAGQGFQDMGDVFSSFGNIFEEFFGFSGGGGGRGRGRRGADLRYDLQLEFEDAVFGAERDIEFERDVECTTCSGEGAPAGGKSECSTCGGIGQVRRSQGFFSVQTTCPSCRGRGVTITNPCKPCKGQGVTKEKRTLSVKVPAGVDSGLRLRVSEEGEGGAGGGSPGDLYVILHVKDHEFFERNEEDIILSQKVGIAQAALGAKIEVPTLEGKEELIIPPGTQHGHRVTISGQGVPHLKGVGRGDLIVEISVRVPEKMTKEQREALEKFAELSGEEVHHGGNGFFSKLF